MECRQHIHYHFNALQLHEEVENFTRQKVHSRPNSCSSPSAQFPALLLLACKKKPSKSHFISSQVVRERWTQGEEEKQRRWQVDPVDCMPRTTKSPECRPDPLASPWDQQVKEGDSDASRACLCKLNQPQVMKLLIYRYFGAKLLTNTSFLAKSNKKM